MVWDPGIDIVSVARIQRALDRFGESFAARILTPAELAIFRARADAARFLAGRFAAKEAIYKAAGMDDLTWQRVAVLPEGRRPVVWVDGVRRNDIRVSISHENEMAVAMAVRTGPSAADGEET